MVRMADAEHGARAEVDGPSEVRRVASALNVLAEENERARQVESAVIEQLRALDVGSALNKMRFLTEKVLHRLCTRHELSWGQAEPTLERMIGPLLASGVVPKDVGLHVRTVQTNASPGSHYQEFALSASHVRIAYSALAELLAWYRKAG